MIRKLVGPVLGIAGLVAIAVGGLALLLRPPSVEYPTGDLGTPVAVVPPNVLALEGLGDIVVTAPGAFDVRTARPFDAYAWVAGAEASVVRGVESWEEIRIDRAGSATGAIPDFPGDLWRDWRLFFEETVVEASDIEPGLVMVVVSCSEAPLGEITFEMTHDRGNGWAWPVIAGGLGAAAVGLVFFAVGLIEERRKTGAES